MLERTCCRAFSSLDICTRSRNCPPASIGGSCHRMRQCSEASRSAMAPLWPAMHGGKPLRVPKVPYAHATPLVLG